MWSRRRRWGRGEQARKWYCRQFHALDIQSLKSTYTCTFRGSRVAVLFGGTMHDKPTPVLPLTEARVQLFRLAEEVLSGEVDHVRLTHRSQPDDLLLMRASAVNQLQSELTELRARVAPAVRPLAGLGALGVTDDELLQDLAASRANQSSAADYKRREIERGLRSPAGSGRLTRVAEKAATGASAVPAKRRKRSAG